MSTDTCYAVFLPVFTGRLAIIEHRRPSARADPLGWSIASVFEKRQLSLNRNHSKRFNRFTGVFTGVRGGRVWRPRRLSVGHRRRRRRRRDGWRRQRQRQRRRRRHRRRHDAGGRWNVDDGRSRHGRRRGGTGSAVGTVRVSVSSVVNR